VPYLLLQAILKYERNPDLDSHTTFVVSMKGTTLQFHKGLISRNYLKDLIDQKVPSDYFTLLSSEPLDLFEKYGRRECLRMWFGLTRELQTQLELYQMKEC
jgi:hypothetical protein